MAKFDFNNSRLAKFFGSQENTASLQSFLDKKEIFFTNYGWYKTQGHNASFLTTTDNYGLATFNVKARKLKAAPMADLRAPLGDSNQMDNSYLIYEKNEIRYEKVALFLPKMIFK